MRCDPALAREENDVDSSDMEILMALRAVRCATLLVRGAGSAILSHSGAKRAIRALKSARLCTISKAGHAVMLDNPVELGAALGSFLRDTADREQQDDACNR